MAESSERQNVMVELRTRAPVDAARFDFATLELPGFEPDTEYPPVRSSAPTDLRSELAASDETLVLIRGTVDAARIDELRADPRVYEVWSDTRVEHFGAGPVG